jgi:hypothetical protein
MISLNSEVSKKIDLKKLKIQEKRKFQIMKYFVSPLYHLKIFFLLFLIHTIIFLMIFFIFSDLFDTKGCAFQIFPAIYVGINLVLCFINIFITFLIMLIFVKEGFGIKIELFVSLLSAILPISSTIISQFSFYNVIEGYFTNNWGYIIGIFFYNFITITIPIIKSFVLNLKKKDVGKLKSIFLGVEKRNDLIRELVEGKDPNSNFNYIFAILEDLDGIDYLKEYSKTEFSIENVFLFI